MTTNRLSRSTHYAAFLSLFFLLAGCVATEVKTEPSPGDEVAHFPQMVVGDTWELELVYNTKAETSNVKIVKVNSDKSFTYEVTSADGEKKYFDLSNYENENKTDTHLNFPLFVGKFWTYTRPGKSTAGLSFIWYFTCRVVAYEPIEIAAGTFNAFKMIETNEVRGGGGEHIGKRFFWYSPELKRTIKMKTGLGYSLQYSEEVLSYKLN